MALKPSEEETNKFPKKAADKIYPIMIGDTTIDKDCMDALEKYIDQWIPKLKNDPSLKDPAAKIILYFPHADTIPEEAAQSFLKIKNKLETAGFSAPVLAISGETAQNKAKTYALGMVFNVYGSLDAAKKALTNNQTLPLP